ncbi:zinc ribbon domain-containing protein [Candidatus Parcubacteria bacterium]|nr:zinc ribbon domain-containing protein [Candidatus Parcubacteria bacterium]
MNAQLQQVLEEAKTRVVIAQTEAETALVEAKLRGTLAMVAIAELVAAEAAVNADETEIAFTKANDVMAKTVVVKTKAVEAKVNVEAELTDVTKVLGIAAEAVTKARAEQVKTAKAAQAMAIAKADADKALTEAREELAKIQPVPAPVPAAEPKPGFWAKLRRQPAQVTCPSCGQKTEKGDFCTECGGRL